jgi:hypothetical protein
MDIMNEVIENGKTNYTLLLEKLVLNGMDKKWAKMFVKKLSDDENFFKVDKKTAEELLLHGFYPGRASLYGMTNENYTDYLPDYQYFMMHPLNHHFRIWVNDKLSLKYNLNSCGCEDLMPEYYLYIENNGNYTYLMDCPNDIEKDKDFIFNLLKKKGILAIKPNSGTSGGRGFMKVEWKENSIYVNNEKIEEKEFTQICSALYNNIITEYVSEHSELAKIWDKSECTLRVIMCKLPTQNKFECAKWHNLVAYARFGSSISGGASNLSSGGIGIGFDYDTGDFNDFGIRYKKFCNDESYLCYEHPDTHVKWSGFRLPNWEYTKSMIDRTCKHLGSLDYLGMDIIITEKGMKYCEINTHPAMDYEQIMCGPVLKNKDSRDFFESHGLNQINAKKLLEMYIESQI